jgi:hypothetical protein
MTQTNAAQVDRQLDHEPPPPSYYLSLWHLIGCKGAIGRRGSFKERLAIKLALWVTAALMRDVETRKMFCLVVATELRRMNAWLDEAARQPPPSDND